MWLLQLIGLVVVVGTALGLVWFYGERWLERRENRRILEIQLADEGMETGTVSIETIATPITKLN